MTGKVILVEYLAETWTRMSRLLRFLEPIEVFFVGVHCPLSELEKRELQRGDRPAGEAPRHDARRVGRLLAVSGWAQFAQAGFLATYGPNLNDAFRRLAVYVDRLLKGARAENLPVELSTRMELAVNMKTAIAAGGRGDSVNVRRISIGSPRIRLDRRSISTARIAGVLCVLLMAGCAGIERAPPREAPQDAAPPGAKASIEPGTAASAPPPEPPQATGAERGPIAVESIAPPAAPSVSGSAGQPVAKPDAATSKAPAKLPSLPAPGAQLPRKETPAPALARPEAPPPLDLKSLEIRLKETKAIGVFTKLALTNQVDDLLEQFRAFYQGRIKTSLAELRRSYDLLVLKVLALLQDADPPLASAIAASRESIWGILSNPAKFAAV